MISTIYGARIWARAAPTDLRRSFNGLSALVERELGHDLRTGDLYLFVNRRRTSARVLHWDGTGLCIYAKKLSGRRFAKLWRQGPVCGPLRLSSGELNLFLEGAEKQSARSRKKT
jgi:transposase